MRFSRLCVWLLAVGLLAVYALFDPSSSVLFPKCPFRMLSGLECPGCGSQRAVHSLLHGDIGGALGYNALLVVSLPYLLLLLYSELMRTRQPRLYAALHRPWMIWMVFVVVIGWWIGRNM